MSGGVDSSVAAALLKEQGYGLTGVFMKNWSGDSYGIQADCPWEQDQKDVEAVCSQLDIPFMTFNFEKEYRERVVGYFFEELRAGRTPNPDVMCNREIKFSLFLERALAKGADLIATGHYARIRQDESGFHLLKGKDTAKDQSYFLHRLTQEQLAKTLFPVGEYTKPEIRTLAKKFGLATAEKKDSQGICFIGDINVRAFMRSGIRVHTGVIRDLDSGEIVGEHDGIEFYTIGQREGLGIGGAAKPYYVADKREDSNELLVVMGSDHPALFKTEAELTDLHWITDRPQDSLAASVRYRQTPVSGDLTGSTFNFDQPVRAVAPGQSVVIYSGDECLGGGIVA
ncbi:MAG: tRNA-specific 2-thiouridylase MnmA [candidate division WS6 bacterium OLB20]|uniref:tRNA-specific 2-thiouridylase MnmA n=1 Tax=candidate division WS6 bacterium OLB20 TaxID=1617426 RepID=A0A136M0H4_9BACT|nr:MAG: tRNA-specific 2-thiouridylase MnmA [candidate division WS6 bacterium OLB20]